VRIVGVKAADKAVFVDRIDDTTTRRVSMKLPNVRFVDMQCEIITPAVTAVAADGAVAFTQLVPALSDVAGEKEPD